MISFNGSSLPGFRSPEVFRTDTAESAPQGQTLSSLFGRLLKNLHNNAGQPLPEPGTDTVAGAENPLHEDAGAGTLAATLSGPLAELVQALGRGRPEDLNGQQRELLRTLTGVGAPGLSQNPGLQALVRALDGAAGALASAPASGRPAALNAADAAATARPFSAATESLPLLSAAEIRSSLAPARVSGSPAAELSALLATLSSHREGAASQLSSPAPAELRPDAPAAVAVRAGATEWAPIKADTSHSQWARELVASLGERLSMQIRQQVKEASVRLDPPELGKVELIVRMDGDRLHIQLNASHAGLRDMLAQHAERLRNDLLAQNLQVTDVQVGQEGHRDPQQTPFRMPDPVAAPAEAEENDDQPAADVIAEKRWLSTSA